MCAVAVGDLIADARSEHEATSVAQLGDELSLQHEEDVPPFAPMVGHVAGRVLDHAHANVADRDGAPSRDAGFARMLGRGNRRPIGGLEGDVLDLHARDGTRARPNASRVFCASMSPAAKPSRQVLNALPFKAFAFLHGVGTSRGIRGALAKVGYTNDAHAEGWALLDRVSGRACSFEGLDPPKNEVRAASAEVVAWEKRNLRRLRAAIAHEHPRYAPALFGFDARERTVAAAMLRVVGLLGRLEALEGSTPGRGVLATLAARGVDAKERRRMATLVQRALTMPTARTPSVDASRDKAVDERALLALRTWLRLWSKLARRAIERADWRERLGLRHRSLGRPD